MASSVTPGIPWIRLQPVAARVVAERWRNEPVESVESLQSFSGFVLARP